MNETEREALIRDLRVLFAEMRRLGYLDGYEPRDDPAVLGVVRGVVFPVVLVSFWCRRRCRACAVSLSFAQVGGRCGPATPGIRLCVAAGLRKSA